MSFSCPNFIRTIVAAAENITSDPAAIAVQEPATAITEYVQETCGLSLPN